MQLIQRIVNNTAENLAIWSEPFCNGYVVPPGSTLDFLGEVQADHFPLIETEATREGLTVYFDHVVCEPDAVLDGHLISPNQNVR